MDQLELLRVIHLWLQTLRTVQLVSIGQRDHIYNQKLFGGCENDQGTYNDMIMRCCHLQGTTQHQVSLLRICPQPANERNRLCV